MERDYINYGDRASEIENPKERKIYRSLELLPGFLNLITLIFAFLFSFFRPVWVAIFIILFTLFFVFKTGYLSYNQIICLLKVRKNLKINFLAKLKKIKNWQNIFHLIILPMYKEEVGIVNETFSALKNCDYPKEKLMVILAVEEKGGEEVKKVAKTIKQKYDNSFYRLKIIFHPKNLEGEIAGKGANTAYAGEIAKKEIIDKEKISYQNVIVSIFDIDTRVYPQYFAVLTYNYLTCKNPLKSSFQPIPVYNNNIWEAPSLTRIISVSNTFWQMIQQERPEQLVTYSSHSMPFEAFIKIGYPKNVVSDDSRIFWKSFFYFNGDYQVVPLYYPVSMDVVTALTLMRTLINQYKQQRRWAWGCTEIPYIFLGFLKNKKIYQWKKFFYSLILSYGFWSWACMSLLILFLGWLPWLVGGEEFKISLLSYNLPRLTGRILTIGMFGMVCGTITSAFFLPPKPRHISWFKSFTMNIQWLFLPLTLVVFGAFPALDASIRLMFGKYMGFWCTPKGRAKKLKN